MDASVHQNGPMSKQTQRPVGATPSVRDLQTLGGSQASNLPCLMTSRPGQMRWRACILHAKQVPKLERSLVFRSCRMATMGSHAARVPIGVKFEANTSKALRECGSGKKNLQGSSSPGLEPGRPCMCPGRAPAGARPFFFSYGLSTYILVHTSIVLSLDGMDGIGLNIGEGRRDSLGWWARTSTVPPTLQIHPPSQVFFYFLSRAHSAPGSPPPIAPAPAHPQHEPDVSVWFPRLNYSLHRSASSIPALPCPARYSPR